MDMNDKEVILVPVKFLDELVEKIGFIQKSLRRKQSLLVKVI